MKTFVVTTFSAQGFDLYGRDFLLGFCKHWPKDVGLFLKVDNEEEAKRVAEFINESVDKNRLIVGYYGKSDEHENFLKIAHDDKTNYRMQPVRFSHKPAALVDALIELEQYKPDYIIWLDADVITSDTVTAEDLAACLPVGDACVAYLGRKDYDHLEAGFVAYKLPEGAEIIQKLWAFWKSGSIFEQKEQHDSYLLQTLLTPENSTNLTEGKPGVEIWPHFPIGLKSHHYKGNQKLERVAPQNGNIKFVTKNCLPDNQIIENIRMNNRILKHWLSPCQPHDLTAVMVAAGPSFYGHELARHLTPEKRIICVKNALTRTAEAGYSPWGCVLLDPRQHVEEFVQKPDTNTIYFAASMVNPSVTSWLMKCGATVVGYHAPTGANEAHLYEGMLGSIVHFGSASATRGISLARMLGFSRFHLIGYDLSYDDGMDKSEKEIDGNLKNEVMTITLNGLKGMERSRNFEGQKQWFAQGQELEELFKIPELTFTAEGHGLAPWILHYIKAMELAKIKQCGYTEKPEFNLWLKDIGRGDKRTT